MSQASVNALQAPSSVLGTTDFSSSRWLEYFQKNREERPKIRLAGDLTVDAALRLPLIRSLQRFQIGETGEGKHLRKFARRMQDADYEQCIDLFIKEEQSHARILAEMIGALDGTLLTWHWTDLAFIALRRMLGLRTEIFILLIAEIIGKCFYMQCARNLADDRLANAFSLIAVDEIAHLEFHCDFLRTQFGDSPRAMRYVIYWGWATLFYAACLVFIFDHTRTLSQLGSPGTSFMNDCTKTFQRAASRALRA